MNSTLMRKSKRQGESKNRLKFSNERILEKRRERKKRLKRLLREKERENDKEHNYKIPIRVKNLINKNPIIPLRNKFPTKKSQLDLFLHLLYFITNPYNYYQNIPT